MQFEPLFPLSFLSGSSRAAKYPDVRPWIMNAIAEEGKKPDTQLWTNEPRGDVQYEERLRRIRLLRKHAKDYPKCKAVANRLEACEPGDRCCSGACPECGRLLQRWFVRKSKRLIRDHIKQPGRKLVAITIIPSRSIIGLGGLHTLSLPNMQCRLKRALKKADLDILIGGIDFSFNEDHDGNYQPFWSPHFYLITSVSDERKLKRQLKKIFKATRELPRPNRVSKFHNSARRRSYAFKMVFKRRIGLTDKKRRDGRECRNTSGQRLRATERVELFMYLDQVGFEHRLIFRKVEPSFRDGKVAIKPIPAGRHRIRRKSKNGS